MKINFEKSILSLSLNINLKSLLMFILLWILTSVVDFLVPYKSQLMIIAVFGFLIKLIPFAYKFEHTGEEGITKKIDIQAPSISLLIATLYIIFKYPAPFTTMDMKITGAVFAGVIYILVFAFRLLKTYLLYYKTEE